MTGLDPTSNQRRRWFADWRVWLGVSITAVCLWYVARDVPVADVAAAFRRADIWLLVSLSVPAHVLGIYVRALRWRHLTNPIAPMTRGLLYRAQSLGFLVNNIVPLRMGELVRAWYLARESGTRGAAVLGTIVLERALDIVSVLLMAGISLAILGASAGDGQLARGARLMLPAAFPAGRRHCGAPFRARSRAASRCLADSADARSDRDTREWQSGAFHPGARRDLRWRAPVSGSRCTPS